VLGRAAEGTGHFGWGHLAASDVSVQSAGEGGLHLRGSTQISRESKRHNV